MDFFNKMYFNMRDRGMELKKLVSPRSIVKCRKKYQDEFCLPASSENRKTKYKFMDIKKGKFERGQIQS